MFPNPQDALPLPRKPNLEHYKKLAKDLVKACRDFRSGDTNALTTWSERWLKSLARFVITRPDADRLDRWLNRMTDQVEGFARRQLTESNKACRIGDAQFVIARSSGFSGWQTFVKHINSLAKKDSPVAKFEEAVEAVISGDVRTLKRLLRANPQLVQERSTRNHRSTLLHYVSANGVEGYRQQTPKNAVEIAELLLKAGAEVDAEADVYGGGATTLGLVGTSVHPFRAGVQNPLMLVLLDHGADINHPRSAGNEQPAVLGCLANGRPTAARYLAERGARLNLESAAGVGNLDVVKSYFRHDGSPKSKVSNKQVSSALLTACVWGQNNVIEFFLKNGVDLGTHGGDGQTPLHCAAIGGQLETIKLLLKWKPALEARNIYGGTVLGQTLWSASHGGDPKLFSEIIETLIAAGAKVSERHVPVNKTIDNLLRRYGSRPEPSWYWFGEKPKDRGLKKA